MATLVPITFGSLYFAPKVVETKEFSQVEFFETVRRCLGGIEGVRDITIDLDPEASSIALKAEPSNTDPEEVYVGPHWDFALVEFELHVPRAQQAHVEGPKYCERLGEHFYIRLAYGWQVPVSAVEVLDQSDAKPTSAAGLVYRYLRGEVQRSAEQLVLACIPPIFVHADFLLVAKDSESGEATFALEKYSRPAYHRYEYTFDPAETPDPAGVFFFEIQSELDLYFRSQDADREEGRAWAEISEQVDALIDIPSQARLTTLRRVRRGRQIRAAATSLMRFAAQRQLVRSQLTRDARATYASGTRRLAHELVEEELDDCVEYPIEQFSQLVQMFESGRLVELQIFVVILAAAIGAVVGAAATLIAAG